MKKLWRNLSAPALIVKIKKGSINNARTVTAINALTTAITSLKATMDLILGQVTLIAINTTPAEDTTPDEPAEG